MGDNTSPISVILVSSGSRGNKLLFRYPFQRSQEHPASQTSKWQPAATRPARGVHRAEEEERVRDPRDSSP